MARGKQHVGQVCRTHGAWPAFRFFQPSPMMHAPRQLSLVKAAQRSKDATKTTLHVAISKPTKQSHPLGKATQPELPCGATRHGLCPLSQDYPAKSQIIGRLKGHPTRPISLQPFNETLAHKTRLSRQAHLTKQRAAAQCNSVKTFPA